MTAASPFGAWLKARRKELGLSQKELAGAVGCSIITIAKLETGERQPSRQIAELLAGQLGVPAAEYPAFVEFTHAAGPPEEGAGAAPWRTLRAVRQRQSWPHTLPAPRTAFVGRAALVAEVSALLRRPAVRLVTLVGPPGIGKTRLSLQVAAALLADFPDGVFFANLAAATGAAEVPAAFAAALHVRQAGSAPLLADVQDYLRDKRLLLVCDNWEHVLAAAPLLADLLTAVAGLTVLATSREALHLYGEHLVPLPPLLLPPVPALQPAELLQYEAIQLFADRAQAARHDFAVTGENGPAIVEICQRLEGVPLAIELAAAQVDWLAPAALRDRLARPLDLLRDGPRDLPPRQQAIRAAIDWSYHLLDTQEQAVLAQLAVFAEGFTPDTVAAVVALAPVGQEPAAETIATILAALLRKNLIHAATGSGEGTRLALLETIREYARERLDAGGGGPAARRRHAAVFLALAEEAAPHLRGPDQGVWFDRLEEEHGNLRAALRYDREVGTGEAALRLAAALWRFWLVRGYISEGRAHLAAVLAKPTPEAEPAALTARANALNGAGVLASIQGDYTAAQTFFTESLAILRRADDQTRIAALLSNLGNVARAQGDYPRARELQDESLAIRRRLGDRAGTALSLSNLGNVARGQGDAEGAWRYQAESVVILRELGDGQALATALHNLAAVAEDQGDLAQARALREESLAARRVLGDKRGVASSLQSLGEVLIKLGDPAGARVLLDESLRSFADLGDKGGIILCLEALALVALAEEQAALTVRLAGAAHALRVAIALPSLSVESASLERATAQARTLLGEQAFARHWEAGSRLGPDAAIQAALQPED